MIFRYNIIRLFITLYVIFFIVGTVSAETRGVRVVSKQGKELCLYKDYHALVVGVGDYEFYPDLQGAVKDARAVAGELTKTGMKVKLLLNPTSQALKAAMNNLTYGVGSEKDRAILFFFSGHGETETLATGEKLGYIIPKDAPLPSKDRIGFTNRAISMNEIETYALRIQSKHVLMIFDSCFSGAVFASLKGVPTDITEKSNRPVRQFIAAGNEEEQVPDVSVFKTCLIQGIKGEADGNSDGYVTGSELGMYLDSSVVNYSRGSQHPQYGKINNPHLDKGDFIFQLGKIEDATPFSSGFSFETKEQRFAEERTDIERQRREIEELKALAKEREKLEAERKRLVAVEKKDSQSVDSMIDRSLNAALESAAAILDEMKALVSDENK